MSREQLLGLVDDVDRLLGAGASAAIGNEKLQNRGRVVRDLAGKVPALAPVADAIDKVVQSDAKKASSAFLDLLVMTRQLRASLSSAGIAGDIQPPVKSGPWTTQQSVRELYPAQEQLQNIGGGREKFIREAVENNTLNDLRLVTDLIQCLDDNNYTIADMVAEKVLPKIGPGVVAEVMEGLDLQGKTAEARRLGVVCRIDKKKGLELCRQAIKEGSVAMRVKALEMLPDVVDDPDEAEKAGLELIEDKKGEVRAAAVSALRKSKSDKVLDILLDAAEDKSGEVCAQAAVALKEVPNTKASPRLLEKLEQHLEKLKDLEKEKRDFKKEAKPAAGKKAPAAGKKKAASSKATVSDEEVKLDAKIQKQIERVIWYIEVLSGRKDTECSKVAADLMPLARHNRADIRTAAVRALGGVVKAHADVMPAIIDSLEDTNANLQQAALEALQRMTPAEREPAVTKIMDLVKKSKVQSQTKYLAYQILPQHMATRGKEVLALMKEALGSKDHWLLHTVIQAVSEIGPAATSLLPEMIDSIKRGAHYGYMNVFAKVDPEGTIVLPELLGMLKNKKLKGHWYMIMHILGEYGAKATSAVPILQQILLEDDSYIGHWAENTLRRIS